VLDGLGSPLVRVDAPTGTTVAAKVESRNPGGSAKDRPALYMVEAAEEAGDLTPGDGIVEPTSGNTGIGLAMVGAVKGYDVTLVMPSGKSVERRRLMRAYGADVELVDGDISEAKDRADALERDAGWSSSASSRIPPTRRPTTRQPDRRSSIRWRTAPSTPSSRASARAAPSPGSGAGSARRSPTCGSTRSNRATTPSSGGEPGIDEFQGMGPGFVSPNLDTDLLDHVHTVDIEDAEAECRRLAREEGLLVGQSSGASTSRPKNAAELRESDTFVGDEPLVVTVFWDSGERYLTAGTFDE